MADFEYTVDGTIGLMRLNRPEKMNAISYEMLNDIEDAIRRAGTDERVRAVVPTGVGRAFIGTFEWLDQLEPLERFARPGAPVRVLEDDIAVEPGDPVAVRRQ